MRPWVSKYLLYLPVQALRGERVLRHLRDLERSQWDPPEVLARRRDERLRQAIAETARHVPFYRDAWRARGVEASGIAGAGDLGRLPVVEKADLRDAGRRLVSEVFRGRLDLRRTSGSTGVPLSLFRARDTLARIRALWYRGLRWYGIDMGSRQGRLLGHPVDRRAKLREDVQDFILNKHRLDPVYLTPEHMRRYWRAVLRRPPDHLYGYPSAMVALARFLEAEGQDPRRAGIRALVCTGENLYPFQRDLLAESFGAVVVNEYGCTESGVIAFPCPEERRLHVSADHLVVEVLTGGRPARPGEAGEVVLTELHGLGAPLVRYRLGDVVVQGGPERCPCGRGLPTLERIEGRSSEMIRLADGREVHSEAFAYIADAFGAFDRGIQGFRVSSPIEGTFVLRLVADHPLERATLGSIEDLVRRVLGAGIHLRVEQVAELPRDPSGKLRYFVREDAGGTPGEDA